MAAYLRFYQLERSPFENQPKKGLVLGTQSLRAAFSEIRRGLKDGSPRICLSGSHGVGKTSLCRALPKLLKDDARIVTIMNPQRPWEQIRSAIAQKLELPGGNISRRSLSSARDTLGVRLVLVIDKAELMSHESLDHLDVLLQYRDDEDEQLLQCVLLADLEAAATGTEMPLLWWLDKFNTLQLQFAPIPVEGIGHYISKHLSKAGWNSDNLFDPEACTAVHRYTGGIPREINDLCERALVEAGVRAMPRISARFIEELCGDAGPLPIIRDEDTSPIDASMLAAQPHAPTAQEMLDNSDAFAPPPDTAQTARRELMEEPIPLTDAPIVHQEADESDDQSETTVSAGLELADNRHPLGDPTEMTVRARSTAPVHRRSGGAQRTRKLPQVFAGARVVLLFALFVAALFTLHSTGEVDLVGPLVEQLRTLGGAEEVDPTEAGIDEFVQKMNDRAAERAPSRTSIPTPNPAQVAEAWSRANAALDQAEADTAAGANVPTQAPVDFVPDPALPAKPTASAASGSEAVPTEMMVINEYTALPEAASNPNPAIAEGTGDPAPAAPAVPTGASASTPAPKPKAAPKPAAAPTRATPRTTPAAPAKPAPRAPVPLKPVISFPEPAASSAP